MRISQYHSVEKNIQTRGKQQVGVFRENNGNPWVTHSQGHHDLHSPELWAMVQIDIPKNSMRNNRGP